MLIPFCFLCIFSGTDRRIKYAQKSASSQIGHNFRLFHDFIVWFRDTIVWHSLQIKWMIRLRSWASFTAFFYFKLSLIYGIVSTVWQFGWREDGENEFSIVLLVTFLVFLTSIPHFAERHLAPDLLRHSQAKDFSPEGQDDLKWRPRKKKWFDRVTFLPWAVEAFKPFNSFVWPRQNFSLKYQWNIKQTGYENK